MKTKTIIYSLLFGLCLGCAKDDGPLQPGEEGTMLLARVESDFLDVEVTYNDDGSIQKLAMEDIFINFQYGNGRISTLQIQYNGPNSEAGTYLFTYDENGRIDSMTDDDLEIHEVVFDEAENTYQYNFDEDEYVTVQITADDEIAKMTTVRPNYETSYEYFYVEENKGPLWNTNPVAPHILLAVPDAILAFVVTEFTKKPLVRYVDGDETYNFENSYDAEGHLVSRDYEFGDDPARDVFEYMRQ